MGMKKWQPPPSEAATAFAAATRDVTGLEHRKMFGYDAVFAKGKMVGGLHEAGMVLRLSDADRERMTEQHGAKPFVVMGRTMREYVVVPPALLEDPAALSDWVRRGLAYTSSVAAKPPRASAAKKTTATRPAARAGRAKARASSKPRASSKAGAGAKARAKPVAKKRGAAPAAAGRSTAPSKAKRGRASAAKAKRPRSR
jgi:TfoX/Sxy family transcriptional regulator of competence genes